MSKKNYEFESARAGIRETATALFTTGGIHSSSLADIAKAAKLSKGTLYYYYPTKEYLISDILEHHLNQTTDLIFAWIDSLNADMRAGDAIRNLIQTLTADPAYMQLRFVLMCEALHEQGEQNTLKQRFAAKQKEWCVMIEVGLLKLPDAGAKKTRRLCKILFALLDGCSMHALLGEEVDWTLLQTLLTEEDA